MGIRPQSEIDEEARQLAFEKDLENKLGEDAPTTEQSAELPDPDGEEIEVIEGEPPAEELDDKSDTESNVLGKLVDLLESRQAPAPTPEPIPERAPIQVTDKAAVKKKFNDEFYKSDDPFSLVEESAQALVGGALAQQSLEIQKLKKEVLKTDPINSMIFENWGDEVEREIVKLPAGQQVHPDAYDYALKQVRDKHFMEILEAKVDERLSAKTRPGATPVMGATRGATAKPKKKSRTVYASARDKAEAKRYGVSLKDYLKGQGKL